MKIMHTNRAAILFWGKSKSSGKCSDEVGSILIFFLPSVTIAGMINWEAYVAYSAADDLHVARPLEE